jgi:hypothetical protein
MTRAEISTEKKIEKYQWNQVGSLKSNKTDNPLAKLNKEKWHQLLDSARRGKPNHEQTDK